MSGAARKYVNAAMRVHYPMTVAWVVCNRFQLLMAKVSIGTDELMVEDESPIGAHHSMAHSAQQLTIKAHCFS